MANLSIRRLDEETVTRLKMRAEREGVSVEETVRRILRTAVVDEEPLGSLIRRIVGKGLDLDLPKREPDIPIDFSTDDYGRDREGHGQFDRVQESASRYQSTNSMHRRSCSGWYGPGSNNRECTPSLLRIMMAWSSRVVRSHNQVSASRS